MSSQSGNKRRWACYGTVRSHFPELSSAMRYWNQREKQKRLLSLQRGSCSLINRTEKWTEANRPFQTRHKSLCPWKHRECVPRHLHVCTHLHTSVPLYWSLHQLHASVSGPSFRGTDGRLQRPRPNIRQTRPLSNQETNSQLLCHCLQQACALCWRRCRLSSVAVSIQPTVNIKCWSLTKNVLLTTLPMFKYPVTEKPRETLAGYGVTAFPHHSGFRVTFRWHCWQ